MEIKTMSFHGRSPCYDRIKVGNKMDNLASRVRFVLHPELDDATVFLYLSNENHSDIIQLEGDRVYTPTRNQTQYPGRWTAYLEAQQDGDVVWHSDPFGVIVGDLPDTGERIEQAYPTAVEEAMNAAAQTAIDRAEVERLAGKVETDSRAASEAARNADLNAKQTAADRASAAKSAESAAQSAAQARNDREAAESAATSAASDAEKTAVDREAADASASAAKQSAEQAAADAAQAEAYKNAAGDSAAQAARDAEQTAQDRTAADAAATSAASDAEKTAVDREAADASASAAKQSAEQAAADAAQVAQDKQEVAAKVEAEVSALRDAILSGTKENAAYHLGFYRDENGELCEVEDDV